MMTQQDRTQIMSRIIQLESENTKLIFDGHKPVQRERGQGVRRRQRDYCDERLAHFA